ncbi:MAG: energy transducer TonB [Saprospiraceae bacterium]|nr:energy transducer TonB [Saprospiraceae bacterium]
MTNNEDVRFLELLRRWQSGDFTRADERELFALAASDPFRQEALEGFMVFPEADHVHTLELLKRRLPRKRKKVVTMPQMFAIAAACLLLIAAIWFFNVKPMPGADETLAQQETAAPVPPTNLPPTGQSDAAKLDPLPSSRAKTIDTDRSDAASGQAPIADKSGPGYADVSKSDDMYAQPPGAIAERSTNVAPEQELAKEFITIDEQKTPSYPVTSAPTESRAEGDAYKKKAPAKAKSKADSISLVGANPVNGWDAFNQYVRKNARLTPAALANNVSGIVRLRFYVNQNNLPENFEIVNKLGFGCDEAAIQLVKSWSWVRENNQPVVVDIPFVR